MKKTLKRLSAVILVLAMLVTAVPVFSLAAYGTAGSNINWTISEGILKLTGSGNIPDYSAEDEAPWFDYRYDIKEVIIDSGITDIGDYAFAGLENLYTLDCGAVKTIGDHAFYGCDILDYVRFGDAITEIGNYAFAECSNLISARFPNSLESIGDCAFMETGLTGTLTFGNNLKEIGDNAFNMCYALTNVVISDSVVSIGDYAFKNCEFVETVTIGKSVCDIGKGAFAYCTDLKEIENKSENFTVYDGALVTADQKTLIAYPLDRSGSINITAPVKEIIDEAFAGSYTITSITLPTGLENIGDGAFMDCWALESITLPSTLKTIGDKAFASAMEVKSITIPDSVTSIGNGAFRNTYALENINVANANSHYTSKDGILYNKDTTTLIACPGSKGTPKGGDKSPEPTVVSVPDTVREIAPFAFAGCMYVDAIVLPSSLQDIGDMAFAECYDITNITIPTSVRSIGDSAFVNCTFLTSINVTSGNRMYCSQSGILFSYDKSVLISYPAGKSGSGYEVPDGVKEIKDYAFAYSTLKRVRMPDSVTAIGDNAFHMCESLKELTVGEGLTRIGNRAFSDCISLENVKLPRALETIGDGAFEWCYSLQSVTFEGSTYIGSAAFLWCASLAEVIFEADAPSDIGRLAFRCCDEITIRYAEGMSGWTSPTWRGYKTAVIGDVTKVKGDVDGDGIITTTDLVLVARHIVGIVQIDESLADVNGNGLVETTDLVLMARMLLL